MSETPNEAELRQRFEAEVMVAGLRLLEEDREPLWRMWKLFYPRREAFRQYPVALAEEPTFTEKPTQGRGM